MESIDLVQVLPSTIDYLRKRTAKNINFETNFPPDQSFMCKLNIMLFEWVIENLCKNAIDAMNGQGTITISIAENNKWITLDVHNTGKGIHKSNIRHIFRAGYSTKKRGWGLGLSLSKRIIKTYHKGKIFLKNTDSVNGTTFTILLKSDATKNHLK